jgi:cytochrome c oxidase subunit 2
MNPHVVLALLIALGVIWTAGWAAVLLRSPRAVPFESIEGSETSVRLVLLASFSAIAIVLFMLTLRWLPYQGTRVAELGPPRVTVAVTGAQWSWVLSRTRVPMGIPVEFAVNARDVNHDFGLYDPRGRLVAQVQAMPGYTNRLVYLFSAPGTYTVRCLEYCGLAHHSMTASITVTER